MNSKEVHVLLLTPGFPADESDGYCIPPFQVVLNRLLKQYSNFRLSVIALHYPDGPRSYLWRSSWVNVPKPAGSNLIGKLRLWNRVYDLAKTIHRQKKVDVIHSLWMNEPAYLGERISNRINASHVCTVMGQDARRSNRYLRFINSASFKTVAVSDFQASVYEETLGRKPDLIVPWAIEENDFPQFNTEERPIDLLGTGGLIPLKDYGAFIETVALLKSDFPNIKAEICGEGPKEASLIELVDQLGLASNVKVHGWIPRAEVLAKMNQSKVFFHPSTFESYGYASAEALYSGARVVSRKVGIAADSDSWKIGNSTNEFAIHISNFLKAEIKPSRVSLGDPDQLVTAYAKLYGL